MLKIPYNSMELRMAVVELNGFPQDEIDVISKKLEKCTEPLEDKKQINKMIAEDNGITVLELINSNNYEILKEEFQKSFLYKTVDLMEEVGLTNVQAWALIASSIGLLNGIH